MERSVHIGNVTRHSTRSCRSMQRRYCWRIRSMQLTVRQTIRHQMMTFRSVSSVSEANRIRAIRLFRTIDWTITDDECNRIPQGAGEVRQTDAGTRVDRRGDHHFSRCQGGILDGRCATISPGNRDCPATRDKGPQAPVETRVRCSLRHEQNSPFAPCREVSVVCRPSWPTASSATKLTSSGRTASTQ
jgi:hypothetical protein